jgi:hypothetical protein
MEKRPVESFVEGVRTISEETDPEKWNEIKAYFSGNLSEIQVSYGSVGVEEADAAISDGGA